MLQQVSHIWHSHAYEQETMAQVVFELRQALSLANVQFDDCSTVDEVFVGCFEDAYKNVSGVYSCWRNFAPTTQNRPADNPVSWEVLYDTDPDMCVLGEPAPPTRHQQVFHWMLSDGEADPNDQE